MKSRTSCKTPGLLLIVGFLVFSVYGCASAPMDKPGGIVADEITDTATVTAVNTETRAVTLKFDDGSIHTYKLSEAVKNFNQINVGDKVRATYVESVAVFVSKSDEQAGVAQVQTVQVTRKGDKPGILVTNTFQVTAKVEAIDYDRWTVTLRGPSGELNTYSVDKSVERFNNVKVGDDVVVQVTDAMLLAVEKA